MLKINQEHILVQKGGRIVRTISKINDILYSWQIHLKKQTRFIKIILYFFKVGWQVLCWNHEKQSIAPNEEWWIIKISHQRASFRMIYVIFLKYHFWLIFFLIFISYFEINLSFLTGFIFFSIKIKWCIFNY